MDARTLSTRTIPQLRQLCRDLGIRGHSRRGIRKADIIQLLLQSNTPKLQRHKSVPRGCEPLLPWDVFYEISRTVDKKTFGRLLRVCKGVHQQVMRRRYARAHEHLQDVLSDPKKRPCLSMVRGIDHTQTRPSINIVNFFVPEIWPGMLVKKHFKKWIDYSFGASFCPPTPEMVNASINNLDLQELEILVKKMNLTAQQWYRLVSRNWTFYTKMPEALLANKDIQLAIVRQKVGGVYGRFPRPVDREVRLAAARHNYHAVNSMFGNEIDREIAMAALLQNRRAAFLPQLAAFVADPLFMKEVNGQRAQLGLNPIFV